MPIRRPLRLLLLVLACALGAAPASALTPQEVACPASHMTDLSQALLFAKARATKVTAAHEDAERALDAGVALCAQRYGWSAATQTLVREYARLAIIRPFQLREMAKAGLSPARLNPAAPPGNADARRYLASDARFQELSWLLGLTPMPADTVDNAAKAYFDDAGIAPPPVTLPASPVAPPPAPPSALPASMTKGAFGVMPIDPYACAFHTLSVRERENLLIPMTSAAEQGFAAATIALTMAMRRCAADPATRLPTGVSEAEVRRYVVTLARASTLAPRVTGGRVDAASVNTMIRMAPIAAVRAGAQLGGDAEAWDSLTTSLLRMQDSVQTSDAQRMDLLGYAGAVAEIDLFERQHRLGHHAR